MKDSVFHVWGETKMRVLSSLTMNVEREECSDCPSSVPEMVSRNKKRAYQATLYK